jgi:hypothetical protein
MRTITFIAAFILFTLLLVSYRVYRQRIMRDRRAVFLLHEPNTGAYMGSRYGRIGVIPFFTKTS